jgi:hypothetical protein
MGWKLQHKIRKQINRMTKGFDFFFIPCQSCNRLMKMENKGENIFKRFDETTTGNNIMQPKITNRRGVIVLEKKTKIVGDLHYLLMNWR